MSSPCPHSGLAPHGSEPWARLLELAGRSGTSAGLSVRCLKGDRIPQPYRELLVHSRDMTPTLARFYENEIDLRVLARKRMGSIYIREVVLEAAGQAVEYGVIRILLDHFPPGPRERVLEERTPLGAILLEEGIPHIGWPQNFFEALPDEGIQAALRLEERFALYGRRNVLLDGSRRLLAEVVEILAPVTKETDET